MDINIDSQLLAREQPRNHPENARVRGAFSDRLQDALGTRPRALVEPKPAPFVTDITDVVKTAAAEQPADTINKMMMALNNPVDGVADANDDGVVNVLDIVKNSNAVMPENTGADEPDTVMGQETVYADIKNVVASISAGETAEAMNMMAWALNAGPQSVFDSQQDGVINVQDVVLNTTAYEPTLPISADIMTVVQSINQKQPVQTMAAMATMLYGPNNGQQDVNLDGTVDILDLVKMTAGA